MNPSDIARLETHVLELLDEGKEIRVADLHRAFPSLEETDIERVWSSAQILRDWQSWLQPGDRIGGYEVLRRIPGGGMGQVYQALQESLDPRQVALKVYRLGEAPERELSRARLEAAVASSLAHPHLVAVHDMGHDEERGLAYFSMQLVEGSDLRDELGEEKTTRDTARVRRVVTRISEVAGALAELHGKGFVHRDVKPENILLRRNAGRDGRSEAAVLVDFGLVRAERALRGEGVSAPFAGTPGYAPPEAECADGEVTPAWDVFSLGVVLYELLRGRPLSRDARGSPQRPTATELSSLRTAVTTVDADLSAIVRRATLEDPSARYADAGEFQRDLERWLAGELVSARRPPAHERLWRAARRHPWRSLRLVVSISVILVALWLIAAEIATVREGCAAVKRGELVHGWERLTSVPPLFVRAFFSGPDELKSDLLEHEHVHPVTGVVHAERELGRAAALDLTAAFLERDGFERELVPQHPELQAYFLRALESPSSGGARAEALHTTARLFLERPVEEPMLVDAVARYRKAVTEILAEPPRSSRDEQLHAACALGGCGTPRDLGRLLDWIQTSMNDVEVIRLGLRSCERIVRRARPIQHEHDLSPAEWKELEERFVSLWREWRESARAGLPEADQQPPEETWKDWIEAWAFLHRHTGHRVRLPVDVRTGPWRPNELFVHAALFGPEDLELQTLLASRVDAEELLGSLRQHEEPHYVLGQLCAYIDSEELLDAMESNLRGDPCMETFRDGWRDRSDEVKRGPSGWHVPDPESRLLQRLGHQAPPLPPSALELDESEALPPGAVAFWSFAPSPIKSSWARDLMLGDGTRWQRDVGEGTAHLRLPRTRAWVEAPFDIESGGAGGGYYVLMIRHLAASRVYLPFEGRVWIHIELDGNVVADRLLVEFAGLQELRIPLDRSPPPGLHVLRVTVVESTTTYWIFELRLERVP